MADGSYGYCCTPFSSSPSTCAPDETVTGCTYPAYGFSCALGDDPTMIDASLVCSAPVPVRSTDLYCCR
jgi:hypothetical protein